MSDRNKDQNCLVYAMKAATRDDGDKEFATGEGRGGRCCKKR